MAVVAGMAAAVTMKVVTAEVRVAVVPAGDLNG
jgi:hypothetical protein